jgi:hypothetical protein
LKRAEGWESSGGFVVVRQKHVQSAGIIRDLRVFRAALRRRCRRILGVVLRTPSGVLDTASHLSFFSLGHLKLPLEFSVLDVRLTKLLCQICGSVSSYIEPLHLLDTLRSGIGC